MNRRKYLSSLISGEQGSVLIVVTLSMVVLLGFAALVIDGGYLYFRHTRLQDIADAMALAGAHKMRETNVKSDAFDKAIYYARQNKLSIGDPKKFTAKITYAGNEEGTMTVSFPAGIDKVKVDLKIDANLYFAQVLGKNGSSVAVSATAEIGHGGVIPVGILEGNLYDSSYEMTLSPGDGSSGNYAWLDFEPKDFKKYLAYGYDGTLKVTDTVKTYPGETVGQADPAIDIRIDGDTCTYDAHDENCPRLVYVPIVNELGTAGKSVPVKIVGFAAFFLEEYHKDGNNIYLQGRFIEEVTWKKIASSDLGHTVRLVD